MTGVLLDTNIVSTFIKIDQLPLLASLFPNHSLTITGGVLEELSAAGFLDVPLRVTYLTRDEATLLEILTRRYGFLGKGELECITICLSRSLRLLTNDRKAKTVARENNIGCWDLPEILRAMLLKGIIEKDQLRKIIRAIETRDNIIFKNADRLWGFDP